MRFPTASDRRSPLRSDTSQSILDAGEARSAARFSPSTHPEKQHAVRQGRRQRGLSRRAGALGERLAVTHDADDVQRAPGARRNGVAAVSFLALTGLASLFAVAWLITVSAHIDDGYGIDHVSGTWIALARYVDEGTLYPPLYDGDAFGGTRFMPVPILAQAGAALLSGEYLVSAKVLSAVLSLALTVVTFLLLRRRCPLPVALALSSTLLVTGTGLVAATSVRNDTLPLLLQLVSVTLVASSASRTRVIAAGLLCGVALLCKLSAVWGPVAIACYLARRDRRGLPVFVVAIVGALLFEVVAFQVVSGGRFADNILELSATGSERFGSFDDASDRVRLILREGLGPLILLPLLAAVGTVVAVRRRDVSIYHFAFVAALLATSVVLVDPGAYVNHLLDIQVLSLLVIGELWRHLSPAPQRSLTWASLAIVVLLVAASALTFRENVSLRRDFHVLVHGTADRDRLPRLAGAIAPGERILSEDPFVSVSRDVRPVILDSYMLLTLLERHPEWRRDLLERIEEAEFDKVVLYYVPSEAPQWYERIHLGTGVIRAVERRYRPARRVDGYWIYVPR